MEPIVLDAFHGCLGGDVCDWIRANGLDPSRTQRIVVDGVRLQVSERGSHRERTVPLVVPPSDDLARFARDCERRWAA